MKAAKTRRSLKEIPYPSQKKLQNFFRMPKINNLHLSNEKQRTKMKLGQLQEIKISKASFQISAGLSNDFKSTLETGQRKNYPL